MEKRDGKGEMMTKLTKEAKRRGWTEAHLKKEWVGLTAYEIQEIHFSNPHFGNFACAIEAKLKEKNHG